MNEEKIVSIKEAPSWMVDNYHLLTGYRLNFKSPKRLLRSLFMKHNELLNIWTHLIGSIVFIGLFIFVLCYRPEGTGIAPLWVRRLIEYVKGAVVNGDGVDIMGSKHGAFDYFGDSSDNKGNLVGFYSVLGRGKDYMVLMSVGIKGVYGMARGNIEAFELGVLSKFDFSLGVLFEEALEYLASKYKHYKSVVRSNFSQSIEKANFTKKIQTDSNDTSCNNTSKKDTFHDIFSKPQKNNKKPTATTTTDDPTTNTPLQIYPIWIFCICAFMCLALSTTFHIFYPLSCTVNRTLQRLDHAGISILNFGSSFSIFFYFFYCEHFFRIFYSIFIFVACSCVFTVSLMDSIHRPENTKLKSLMYAALGLSNIIPIIHLSVLSYYADQHNAYIPFNVTFLLLILMAAIYLVGLVIYSLHIPERFFPKTFDIWCNSHTIWHCLVFAAAVVHYYNLLIIYDTRIAKKCIV